MVNQIDEPSGLNTGVLQTPILGKGGKPKKSSRSVKFNKTGTQAAGFNAGEFGLKCSICSFHFTQATVSRPMINIYLCALR